MSIVPAERCGNTLKPNVPANKQTYNKYTWHTRTLRQG